MVYVDVERDMIIEGGHHLKGWIFLLRSLKYGFPFSNAFRQPKFWARALLGKTIFEFLREHIVVRHRFPRVGIELK